MRAQAAKPTQKTARQAPAVAAASPMVTPLAIDGIVLRRKVCACGGNCPRCQEKLPLQTKLKVSQPGDVLEQEADRVAEQVMRMRTPENRITDTLHTRDGEAAQRKREDTVGGESGTAITSFLGPGSPLAPDTLAFFESRFGRDFQRVRLHDDPRAARSARQLNALAYTLGAHVVLGESNDSLSGVAGRRLLAHELVHVVQQGAAPLRTNPYPNAGGFDRQADAAVGTTRTHEIAPVPAVQSRGILQRIPIPLPVFFQPCPTSVRLGAMVHVAHHQATSANRNQYRTYVLGVSRMDVGPRPDHSGNCMQESLRFVSSNCPRSLTDATTPCSKSDCLPINQEGTVQYPTGSISDGPTSFLDAHRSRSERSLLEGTGVNACQVVCEQTYSCLGTPASGRFRITRNYRADTQQMPGGTSRHITTGVIDKTEVAPPPPRPSPFPVQPPDKGDFPLRTLPAGEEYG